jgi:alkylation response protein AidB-like acyl-CoA dehydrogenase
MNGGCVYFKDHPVEQLYRDSKLCSIGEGTTEIQKVVVSENLLKRLILNIDLS